MSHVQTPPSPAWTLPDLQPTGIVRITGSDRLYLPA